MTIEEKIHQELSRVCPNHADNYFYKLGNVNNWYDKFWEREFEFRNYINLTNDPDVNILGSPKKQVRIINGHNSYLDFNDKNTIEFNFRFIYEYMTLETEGFPAKHLYYFCEVSALVCDNYINWFYSRYKFFDSAGEAEGEVARKDNNWNRGSWYAG